jgi:hypothetical protein
MAAVVPMPAADAPDDELIAWADAPCTSHPPHLLAWESGCFKCEKLLAAAMFAPRRYIADPAERRARRAARIRGWVFGWTEKG